MALFNYLVTIVMSFLRQLLVTSLLAIFISPAFATNGYLAHGYGIKSRGMAGAGIALPQEALIAATNPAGIVFIGDRLEINASLFSPRRGYEVIGVTHFIIADFAAQFKERSAPVENVIEADFEPAAGPRSSGCGWPTGPGAGRSSCR